jgi:3-oxoacyl-[acyl-carrier protein] reductase
MFEGKVAVITGSAMGIGASIALKMAEDGGRVVINYSKSVEKAEETAALCEKASGEVLLVQANVAEDDDCRRMAKEAMDKWGRIDILVNNAGTTKFADHDDLAALEEQDFLDIYKVNLIGNYQMIRAVEGPMRDGYADGKGDAGSVVNISSIAGIAGIGSSVAYAASKGAVNTMTLSLARSLSPAIRVNAVCPGFVGTGWFLDKFGQEFFDAIVKNQTETTPLKRSGTPEDIADTALFFAGPWSRHVTGETLLVDAGMHLNLFAK